MKGSKKFTIMTIVAIIMSSMLFAQPPGGRGPQGGPPPMPNEEQIELMLDQLSEELSLSPEQKSDVSELYQDHFTDMKKIMNKGQKSQAKQKNSMDKLRSQLDKAVKKVLNEDQQKAYEEYQKKQGPGNKQGGSRPENKLKQPH